MPTSPTLTPNYTVGKAVAVSIGGKLTYCKSGKMARKVEPVKVTNARSQGAREVKAGTKSCDASFELVFNGDDPPALMEGQEVTVIFDSIGYEAAEGIANASSTPAGELITGQFLIVSITDSWQCDGDYGWSLEAQSTGPYVVSYAATGATPTT